MSGTFEVLLRNPPPREPMGGRRTLPPPVVHNYSPAGAGDPMRSLETVTLG